MDIIPGLKGFGTDTRAAYGAANDPKIFVVTNINHSNGTPGGSVRNGTAVKTGSFLEALNYYPGANTGKIILFEVSGTINATSSPYQYCVTHPYIIIAGQTAPSPGINLRNITLIGQTHDVLTQHIRLRVGDAPVGSGEDPDKRDGLTSSTASGAYNTVTDHCSVSWAIDENSHIGEHDATYSNCIIAEALSNSLHSKGEHSKGMNIGVSSYNTSVFNCLYGHNNARNPYYVNPSGYNVLTAGVFVNNFIYNPGDFNTQLEIINGTLEASIVGNLIEGGPSTISSAYTNHFSCNALTTASEIYMADNKCGKEGVSWHTQSSASDWSHVRWRSPQGDISADVKLLSASIWPTGLGAMGVDDVKAYVLANAGARPADRDSADQRVIAHAQSGGTQGAIIDSPSDVGGWPVLAENNVEVNIPSNPHVVGGDGYTNLETWLHELAAEVEGGTTHYPYTRRRGILHQKPRYNMVGGRFR